MVTLRGQLGPDGSRRADDCGVASRLLRSACMSRHLGPVAMRSPMGGLIMPLRDGYDRQVLFEHIINRVRRDSWVDVCVGGERWRAVLMAPDNTLACTFCGETLSIAHTSAGRRLCTRCRMRALH